MSYNVETRRCKGIVECGIVDVDAEQVPNCSRNIYLNFLGQTSESSRAASSLGWVSSNRLQTWRSLVEFEATVFSRKTGV
jgi:hypothetical protein